MALSFIKPCYSKLSSSPTKIAEYLACGLPVVSSAGIGDVDAVIEGDRVGVLVRRFDRDAYAEALEAVEASPARGRPRRPVPASARDRFDLEEVGGARYRRLYQRLAEAAPGSLSRGDPAGPDGPAHPHLRRPATPSVARPQEGCEVREWSGS